MNAQSTRATYVMSLPVILCGKNDKMVLRLYMRSYHTFLGHEGCFLRFLGAYDVTNGFTAFRGNLSLIPHKVIRFIVKLFLVMHVSHGFGESCRGDDSR